MGVQVPPGVPVWYAYVLKRKKDIDAKINELRRVVTKGFSESRKEIDELAQMVAGGFTEIQKEMHEIRDELKGDMKFIRGDIDIMLDRHIGTFRKDYDDLARRVKDLEKRVFAH